MSENVHKILNIMLSLIIAIVAWTFVVYNDDPMTEVTYRNIPIVFEGETALTNNDLGVSEVSASTVDVTLRQMRVRTNDISADDIRVVADVHEAVEGENGISLSINGPENTQVVDASTRSIAVNVEHADSVEKDILITYSEENEGYELVTYSHTSERATAIGAKSEISRVASIAALLDIDETSEKPKNYTKSLVALDSDGAVIDHIVIYPGEINFNAYTGVLKTVKLIVDAAVPDDDFQRTWTAPDTIVIKGSAASVQNINKINTVQIDMNYLYEDTEYDLEYALPDGIFIANESKGKKINIKVERKPEEETEDETGESDSGS